MVSPVLAPFELLRDLRQPRRTRSREFEGFEDAVRTEQRTGHSVVAQCQLGSGSRPDLDVGCVWNASARGACAGSVEISAAFGMGEDAAATGARGCLLITPFGKGVEYRPEAPSSIRQEVFAAARAVLASYEHAFADKAIESVGQHRAGDVEVGQEIVEAAYAEEGVADDQDRPALSDELERSSDGAVLELVVLP
jgi:hypothetical protein